MAGSVPVGHLDVPRATVPDTRSEQAAGRTWVRIPLYPVVFLDAMILMTWGHAELHVSLLVRPLLVATLAVLALTFLIAAVLRDRDRAGIIASATALILLTSDDRAAVVLGSAAMLIFVEGLVRRGRPVRAIRIASRALAIVAVILLVAIGIDLAERGAWQAAAGDLTAASLRPRGQASATHSDIFVILLDAYPGDRVAARATDFDADAFPNALAARGFDVVRDAHSNYLLTPLTLGSMLSMRHLADIPALGPPHLSRTEDLRRLSSVLATAPAFGIARDAGFEVTLLDGGFAHARPGDADHVIDHPGLQELELVEIGHTRIGSMVESLAPGTMAGVIRYGIEQTLATATTLAAPHDVPRLTFVHVPAPHPPWVYDAEGRPRDPGVVSFAGEPGLSIQAELDVGFAQASHIADLTIDSIDRILATSASPPVIVVFSDHGPAAGFSTITPLASDLEVRASSFMAALTPGHVGLFTDIGPTPVNVFGTLFNAYLGTDIPHQDDSIWAWKGESYIDVVEAPPIEGWTK
jgi:hypothetical protein